LSGKAQGPYERHSYLADPHAPYHDEEAYSVAMAFQRVFQPHHTWLLGDFLDFYQLSRFDKNPRRALELQQDIDAARVLMARVREATPNGRITLVKGNHEDRLRRYLWTKAAELSGLRALDVPTLLGLKDLNVEYVESGQVRVADLIIKHGTLVRARSGYTATGELDKAGLSGVSGHTHRLGQVCRRTEAGSTTWIEAGCLCDINPEYLMGNTADWQHGLAYGYMERSGNRFVNHTLPIVNGRVIFDGQEISVRKRK
jgi:predicted phosphodiesterase